MEACNKIGLTEQEKEIRRRRVALSIGIAEIPEGVKLPPEHLGLLDQYIDGEIVDGEELEKIVMKGIYKRLGVNKNEMNVKEDTLV